MISKAFAAAFFCLLAMASQRILADELTPAKLADVRELMQVTGGSNAYQAFADRATFIVVQQLQGRPGFSRKAAEAVRDELTAIYKEGMTSAGGLSDKIEQIYAKYYTHQEVKDLLAFFRSPLGGKFINIGPTIATEALEAGQVWGNGIKSSIEGRLRARLKREGFELPPTVSGPASSPSAQPTPGSPSKSTPK